jgi:hypothetical protein
MWAMPAMLPHQAHDLALSRSGVGPNSTRSDGSGSVLAANNDFADNKSPLALWRHLDSLARAIEIAKRWQKSVSTELYGR